MSPARTICFQNPCLRQSSSLLPFVALFCRPLPNRTRQRDRSESAHVQVSSEPGTARPCGASLTSPSTSDRTQRRDLILSHASPALPPHPRCVSPAPRGIGSGRAVV